MLAIVCLDLFPLVLLVATLKLFEVCCTSLESKVLPVDYKLHIDVNTCSLELDGFSIGLGFYIHVVISPMLSQIRQISDLEYATFEPIAIPFNATIIGL